MKRIHVRTAIGGLLLVSTAMIVEGGRPDHGATMVLALLFSWAISLLANQKYIHKYPQRYGTYLAASHIKSAVTMTVGIGAIRLFMGKGVGSPGRLGLIVILFTLADALVSLVWPREDPSERAAETSAPAGAGEDPKRKTGQPEEIPIFPSWEAVRSLGGPTADLIAKVLPRTDLAGEPASLASAVRIAVSPFRFNDIRRLNRFFLDCAEIIRPNGYLIGRYAPLELEAGRLRRRYRGIFFYPAAAVHFLWRRAFPKIPKLNALYFALTKGKNRVFSKAEIWGRLAASGMDAIEELDADGNVYLLARKTSEPVPNKKPSYYPIVALERVGLNGTIILAHKIRTMYPFSEFLQKRIYERNALDTTGKFAGDFRVTGYGRILRRYWLDEIPQLWDWWRGDIKFVGLRAMSRHYFSLYPEDFQKMYLRVKPGLIPPIFSPETKGFQEIMEVERRYLRRYLERPFRTDTRYLIETVKDIFVRGVRSH